MDVLVLGSGGPAGWPEVSCPCASCSVLRGVREWRSPTAVLVDGVLLLATSAALDALPAEAGRAGTTLAGVRQLLLLDPASGAADGGSLRVRSTEAASGQDLRVPPYRIRVHVSPDDRSAVYDVTSDDAALLVSAGIDAVRTLPGAAAPYDVVLVDASSSSLPEQVAALRRTGHVGPRTDVVAVGLTHDLPPPPELERRLALWGARAVPDYTTLRAGEGGAPRALRPRRTLVLGGARSGKSVEAERRLAADASVVYVATGGRRDGDAEWARRVELHQERRPPAWRTVETTDLVAVLAVAEVPVLVDCLSLWLTAVLDEVGAWHGAPGALQAARERAAAFLEAWRTARVPVVAVSNEVGSGVVPPTASARLFRDELGRLNAAVAEESEEVLLVVAGQVLPLRRPPAPYAAGDGPVLTGTAGRSSASAPARRAAARQPREAPARRADGGSATADLSPPTQDTQPEEDRDRAAPARGGAPAPLPHGLPRRAPGVAGDAHGG